MKLFRGHFGTSSLRSQHLARIGLARNLKESCALQVFLVVKSLESYVEEWICVQGEELSRQI